MTKQGGDGGGVDVLDPSRIFSWQHQAPQHTHSLSMNAGSMSSPSLAQGAWVDRRATPLHNLGESLKTAAQSNANSLVLYAKAAAKSNPDVARLVSNYETWENNLKAEATRRLGTFQPPVQLLKNSNSSGGLLNEDWDLLKRVNLNNNMALSTMKRSASETDLEQMTPNSQWKSKQHGFVGWSFEQQQQELARGYEFRGESDLMYNRPPPRVVMPKVSTAPSLQDVDDTSTHLLAGDLAAKNLEAVAQTIINTSRLAIQSAQQSIQQTAVNCQQNLQALSSALQANVASNLQQGSLGGGKAIVPWQVNLGLGTSSSEGGAAQAGFGAAPSTSEGGASEQGSLSGALVPWAVFPRYLRAKEAESAGMSSSYGDLTEEHKENQQEWYAPFEKYIDSLDNKQLAVRRQQPGYRSLREPGRQVAIVTTAALPWLTGTSVNPLLRAAYLASDNSRKVTLVLPWLSKVDQERIFPNHVTFDTPEDQEAFVREWARKRTGLECNFKISFYPGRYAAEKGSILPVGDITTCIPDHEADVAVLEEPEHLNWYHHGRRWTDKFAHVVGVMHTNYLDYARREEGGPMKEAVLKHINAWMCRIYCHKVIKLSDAVQPLPRQETMFVHGVSPSFIQVGEQKALAPPSERWKTPGSPGSSSSSSSNGSGVYFLGKVLWAKGYTELLDRLKEHTEATGQSVPVDVYGAGPDLGAVQEEAKKRRLALTFNGARDHADKSLHNYKVFINPSLSDVVATTTAEALAMGKYVVCAEHPSNKFFERFPNCLIYRNKEEFSQQLQRALSTEPQPLSKEQLHALTWEAATERFLDVAELRKTANPLETAMDNVLAAAHFAMTGMESLRIATGAGANTRDMPARITDYVPTDNDVGGFFDDKSRARRIYGADKKGSGGKSKQDNAAPAPAPAGKEAASTPSSADNK